MLVQRAPVGVAMVLGGRLLELVPTALVGGILIAFGSSTLVEWIWKSRHRFARFEVEIVIAIVVAVALFGFVAGTVFGIGLAVALFVLRYSRVSVIRHELSGSVITSNVDRTPSEQRRLESRSAEVLVLELRGYLFFGTATAVAEAVARRSTPPRALRSVVFDFSKVTGVDSSTVVAFETIGRLTARAGATLYVAGALPTIEALLLRPIARRGDVVVVSADDIDRALEQCEDHMLHEGRAQARRPPQQVTTYDVLTPVLNDADAVDSVLAHLERRTVDAGEVLVEQGAVSSGLFFLESGRLTARRRVDPVSDRRLRTMLPGTVVGEIGLYLDQPATATVQADEDSVVLWLSPVAFAHLMECEPRVAASLHLYVARILADRVNHTERVTRRLRE